MTRFKNMLAFSTLVPSTVNVKKARLLASLVMALLTACGGGGGGGGGGGTPAFSAAITGANRIVANTRYNFTATTVNGTAAARAWVWGDGTSANAVNSTVSNVWRRPGSFNTQLTATATSNAVATDNKTLTVIATPISQGGFHTCAIQSDQTVACWGDNQQGQLGIGSNTNTYANLTPSLVPGLADVVGLASHGWGTCALNAIGKVYCWGVFNAVPLTNGSNTPQLVASMSDAIAITGGSSHVCALKNDGTVWCWGYGDLGQVGQGLNSGPPVLTPMMVPNLAAVVSVVSGVRAKHTCALKFDKTVVCWGSNSNGQSGFGISLVLPNQVRTVPNAISIANVSSLSVIENTSCAVMDDGTMQCWGSNDSGQFGTGSGGGESYNQAGGFNSSPVASPVSNIAALAIGYPSCAVKTDQTMSCWGNTKHTQSAVTHAEPAEAAIPQFNNVAALSSSVSNSENSNTCALLTNGDMWCRGWNLFGQLGNGTSTPLGTPDSNVFTQVTQLSAPADKVIASGQVHSCAVQADSTVACWGSGSLGQVGIGVAQSNTPVLVSGVGGVPVLSGVRAVAAGLGHNCALKTDSTVVCWGNGSAGQLGNGINGQLLGTEPNKIPVQVSGVGGLGILAGVGAMSSNSNHTCALISATGSVVCWGWGFQGQLGNGVNADSNVPVLVSNLTGVSDIAVGNSSTCALKKADGSIVCWGWGYYGQLGNGSTANSNVPVPVSDLGGAGVLTGVRALASGFAHNCAAKIDGTIACWGYSASGQLGNNSNLNLNVPVASTGSANIVSKIAAGSTQTCALYSSTRDVKCWGGNFFGELGNGSNFPSAAAVAVSSLQDVRDLSSAANHTCALKSGGSVWCWGRGAEGQLGGGNSSNSNSPTKVMGLTAKEPRLLPTFWY